MDDQPANLLAMLAVLEGLGLNLVTASSGREALRHLLEMDFAVILLDVQMPDMDGFETAAMIRLRERNLNTPIIFLTATFPDAEYTGRAYARGAVDYIFKPVLPEILRAKVSVFVELHKKTKQLHHLNEELEARVAERTAALTAEIAERKRVEETLRQAEDKYRRIFEDAAVGIFQVTPEGRILTANPAMAQIHGYDSPEELMAGVAHAGDQLYVNPGQFQKLALLLEKNEVVSDAEVEVYRKDGGKKWLLANVRAIRGADGKVLRHEGTVQDITERKAAEEQIQHLAYHDALTGLPNRILLQDRLAKALASARRSREKVALLFIDIKNFKTVNDSLGHSVGDLLVKETANRLKNCAREQDTIARLGGDEFVAVLTAIKDIADVAVTTDRFLKAMTTEFIIQGHLLGVTCNIGISVFPDHGTDGETLLKNADAAMYCARENGWNNFQFFTQDMNVRAVEHLTLQTSLRLALERKELFLMYQPQVDIATGTIIGAEALVRWRHPELGLVPPDKFIPIAENSGQIIQIGEWVLRAACAQAKQWQDEGLPPVPVAVNVSPVQFRQKGFFLAIRKVLHETRLLPQYLELEFTEGLLLSAGDVTLRVLQELKEMGLKLSIDDFGTGYSSLSYLRHFPVYKLKIDRSFVQSMTVNSDDAAITATIINMAKSLKLKVIAEGVETEEQMSFLRANNCDEVQGYYFSPPLAAGDFAKAVRSRLGCVSLPG